MACSKGLGRDSERAQQVWVGVGDLKEGDNLDITRRHRSGLAQRHARAARGRKQVRIRFHGQIASVRASVQVCERAGVGAMGMIGAVKWWCSVQSADCVRRGNVEGQVRGSNLVR